MKHARLFVLSLIITATLITAWAYLGTDRTGELLAAGPCDPSISLCL
jgi:hypothetical protein